MYSPYNPYGYLFQQNGQQQPFMPGMQQGMHPSMQQPMQSPIQAQQQANSSPVVMQVPSIKQVEQAPVQPGGKALVLVANEPVIAMRTADNMGLTTTDYYHIEKFDPDVAAPVPAGGMLGVPLGDAAHCAMRQAFGVFGYCWRAVPAMD